MSNQSLAEALKHVSNYYDSLTRLTAVSNLQLLPLDVFSDQSLFQEMTRRCTFLNLF